MSISFKILYLFFLFSLYKSEESTINNKHINRLNRNLKLKKDDEDIESYRRKNIYYNSNENGECEDYSVLIDGECKKCADYGKYYEDGKCVEECSPNAKKVYDKKICFTCSEEAKYYSYGGCVSICPDFSVTNKLEKYCAYCADDQFFFNYKCVDKCKEPYKPSNKNRTYICEQCSDGEYYSSGICVSSCEQDTYGLKEDKSCHLCYCNKNNGNCTNTSSICTCHDHYSGENCEFYRQVENNDLKIIPLNNKGLKTGVNFFGFNISSNIIYNEIQWGFSLENVELTTKPEYQKYFVTGNKEEIFGINPYLYSEKNNLIKLHLTIKDNKNNTFYDEIKISAQNLNIETAHRVNFLEPKFQDTLDSKIPMETFIEIDQNVYSNSEQYKYYYKFSFLDEYNEEIPLTNYNHDRSLITYYIPFAKEYLVNLKNDRGELIKSNVVNKDSNVYNKYNETYFNSIDVDDIIKSAYNDIEKIIICSIISKNKILNENELISIITFINENYENFLNEKGFYQINDETYKNIINYSEPKVLFALINSLIINQEENLDQQKINLIINSLKKCVNQINTNTVKLNKEDIISLIRTIEQLLNNYEKNIIKINAEDRKKVMDNFYYLFNKINNYLSLKLYPGEGIKIIGNKIILFNYHFGSYDKFISISSHNLTLEVNVSDITTYSYDDYGLNEDNPLNNEETFLFFDENIYKYIKNELNISKKIALNIYIVNNIKNNTVINQTDEEDNYLINLQFFDLDTKQNKKSNITLEDDLLYSIKFRYKNENKEVNKNMDKNNKFSLKYNYSDVFCYPKNYKEDKNNYCYTYFDYENDIIQCKCNVIDDISIIEDEKLANFYKSLQFESVKYKYTNGVAKRFLVSFIILLLIPGLIFLLCDIVKVKKLINNNKGLTFSEKRREYYNEVKIYTDTKLTFPIYSLFNKFPYCQAFISGYYTSPKYIRHLIVITAILLGFILNLIPFFFFIPFEERQILIDKRDINDDTENIHSIEIIGKYLNWGFIFAFISLIVVHLFIKLFNKILKIDEKNVNYWKNIKDIFKDYVYFKIKKSRYLGKNFGRIKNRMKALYAVCGRFLLNKNIMNHPDRNKKLENYLKYTGKLNKINLSNNNKKIEIKDSNKKDNKDILIKEPISYELPNNNNIINTEYKPPKLSLNIKLEMPIDINLVVNSSYGNNKKIKLADNIKKINANKAENFQISNITENKFNISKNSICRFEKIKNKYMYSNKSAKYDFSNKNLNNNIINNESPLSIYYNNNLSIFNVEEYNNFINNDASGSSGKDFGLLVLMTFVIGLIFVLLLGLSVIMIKKLMNEFEYFMVKIWILCTILILFVVYFLIYFIKIMIASILLFNCYHSRNKGCFMKFMFKIFVDKSLIYMFKVRNYITKYRREFINI